MIKITFLQLHNYCIVIFPIKSNEITWLLYFPADKRECGSRVLLTFIFLGSLSWTVNLISFYIYIPPGLGKFIFSVTQASEPTMLITSILLTMLLYPTSHGGTLAANHLSTFRITQTNAIKVIAVIKFYKLL